MRALIVVGSLALLTTLVISPAPGAAAPERCDVGPLATGAWEITDGTAARTFYVDDRDMLSEHGSGLWIYEESNNAWNAKPAGVYRSADGAAIVGYDLQRGGASFLVPDDNESCHDESWAPDQLIE